MVDCLPVVMRNPEKTSISLFSWKPSLRYKSLADVFHAPADTTILSGYLLKNEVFRALG
jgi:hypothetical protein